jgi:ArsR family transcriptional regulator
VAPRPRSQIGHGADPVENPRFGIRDGRGLRQAAAHPEVLDVHVEHIQAKVGISKSTASQFMAMLQRGLVTSVRKGQWTRYERRDPSRGARRAGTRRALIAPGDQQSLHAGASPCGPAFAVIAFGAYVERLVGHHRRQRRAVCAVSWTRYVERVIDVDGGSDREGWGGKPQSRAVGEAERPAARRAVVRRHDPPAAGVSSSGGLNRTRLRLAPNQGDGMGEASARRGRCAQQPIAPASWTAPDTTVGSVRAVPRRPPVAVVDDVSTTQERQQRAERG